MKVNVGDVVTFPESPPQESDITARWRPVGEPLVTVLCPTYNQVHCLHHAINGILHQQTRFAFEIIVRDDGSQDGTREVVNDYQSRYPAVIKAILESENTWSQGVPAREAMAPFARGKYIALCDGDDFWTDPNKLARQVAILESDENVALVHHEAFRFEDDRIVTSVLHREESRRDLSRADLSMGIGAMPLTMCFRKSAWDPSATEARYIVNGDTFLITQLSRYGGSRYIPEIMAAYRRGSSGMWSGRSHYSRQLSSALSSLWISRYHARRGDKKTADFWAEKAALIVFRFVRGDSDSTSRRAVSALVKLCVRYKLGRMFRLSRVSTE